MSVFWTLIFLLILGGPILVVQFLSVLVREIGRAFRYAWLDLRVEMAQARRYWVTGFTRADQ